MWSTAPEIAAQDVVIIWMTRDLIQPLTIKPDAVLHNKFGVYPHNSLIGTPYGSKVHSQTGRGFVYVLRPTPELWTQALPHRTQILYLADIAFITEWLGIKKGSKVIEAGTGSASFSHSVARTIGPTGHLYSFEFHEQRAAKAREEFERHGMSPFVTLQHRNVCRDGFAKVVDEVDSVFLDLPAPWDAILHAKKALRKDHIARICCFSPCIEQVLRTVSALNEAGFTEITTYETLLRPLEVSTAPNFPSLADATQRLKEGEIKREEKRVRQIKANREKEKEMKQKEDVKKKAKEGKRKHDEVVQDEGADDGLQAQSSSTVEIDHKRLKMMGDADDAMYVDPIAVAASTPAPLSPTSILPGTSSAQPTPAPIVPQTKPPKKAYPPISSSKAVSKALPEIRGHTSYLTFACLAPYELYKVSSSHPSPTAPMPAPVPPADPPQQTEGKVAETPSSPS